MSISAVMYGENISSLIKNVEVIPYLKDIVFPLLVFNIISFILKFFRDNLLYPFVTLYINDIVCFKLPLSLDIEGVFEATGTGIICGDCGIGTYD